MTVEKKYSFNDFSNWNHEIFAAIKDFKEAKYVQPHILLVNTATGKRLDALLSAELFESGHFNFLQGLCSFVCQEAELNICMNEEIMYGEFILIFDTEAYFDEEEDDQDESPPKEGVFSYAA